MTGSGRWTKYVDALKEEEKELLQYALRLKYVELVNDAPRGGKHGEHFLVKKYFTTASILKKLETEAKAIQKQLAKIPPMTRVNSFSTISDIGSFKIDGVCYSNFWGDGCNRVEVVSVDPKQFADAEIITRRQIYNKLEPLTIVKYDTPKSIQVSECDCNDSFGSTKVENVLGFAIWSSKLKIFVAK